MLGSALSGISGKGAPYVLGFGTPGQIGQLFLTTYLLPFEVASLLLLVAAVGAVVLARRRRGLEDHDEQLDSLAGTPRPAYTGTLAEGAGIQRVLDEIERDESARARGGTSVPHRRDGRADGDRLVSRRLGDHLLDRRRGVLTRRNPLVMLLCLELMLNAANLALVAFARMHGNEAGQIFALIVMVVAACEVTVGLGLIVAISPPQPARRRRRAQ